MRKSPLSILLALILSCALPEGSQAFEKIFDKTPVGEFEIKTLPSTRALESKLPGSYFEQADSLFRLLFAYIKEHDVEMTVPVEGRLESAGMRFYVGSENQDETLKNGEKVTVITLPERIVASYGQRGGYSRENISEALLELEQWVNEQPRYEVAAEPYAIFWSPPFVPWFLKRFEVHIPVSVVSPREQK